MQVIANVKIWEHKVGVVSWDTDKGCANFEYYPSEIAQQYIRMVFNIIARNQDDHTKNIAFLMNEEGGWSLSPAFDMTYSHDPKSKWVDQHQMMCK